jgi:hypothetical protein
MAAYLSTQAHISADSVAVAVQASRSCISSSRFLAYIQADFHAARTTHVLPGE